jgi:hypothetical protein
VQVFEHRLNEFCTAALGIEILVAENERSAMLDCPLRPSPKRARVAEMEQPGGRRSKAAAVRMWIGWHG